MANAESAEQQLANTGKKPKDQGPDLSEYGYNRINVIGRGQYGIAQLVSNGSTQFVAKSVQIEVLNEKDQRLAWQEVRLLERLRHPFIVGYIESFSIEITSTLIIVMEYAPNGDLRRLIKTSAKKETRLPENVVMRWFAQLLHALNYVHRQKILHRDLKTSNIFLSSVDGLEGNVDPNSDGARLETYEVKLGDFGISRVLDGTREAAVTVVGTPYYMSPEVCRSEPYNWKSDVWALGCVLYEMCMLKHAFESSSLLGLVYKIVSENYDPIPDIYSEKVMNVINRLLTKSAEQRPDSTEMLMDPYIAQYTSGFPDNEVAAAMAKEQQGRSPVMSGEERKKAPPPKGPPPMPPPGGPGNGVKAPPMPPPGGPPGKAPLGGAPPGCPPPSGTPTGGVNPANFLPPPPQPLAIPPESQELFEVLMARVRVHVTRKKLNWVTNFAVHDKKGNGLFQPDEFIKCLHSLHSALSTPEINFLTGCFVTGGHVALFHFAQKLNTAPGLLAKKVDGVVRQLLDGKIQNLMNACCQHDPEMRGVINAEIFKQVVAQILGDKANDRNVMLGLMSAEKNLSGEVDFQSFCNAFAAPETNTPFAAPNAFDKSMTKPSGTQFFTARGVGGPPPPPGVAPLGKAGGAIGSTAKPVPFRGLSHDTIRIVWSRLRKKFTHCTLKDIWSLYFQSQGKVNPWHFIDISADIPWGVSRAELHQACATVADEDNQIECARIEQELVNADESILTMPSWGNAMSALLNPNTWNATTVSETQFREKLIEADPSLTHNQMDYLVSLIDKTSEGAILLERLPPKQVAIPANYQPITNQHHTCVCRRLVRKLQSCNGLDVPKLIRILQNFWGLNEWNKCLSTYLPLYLSEQEATGLILRLLENPNQKTDEWAHMLQGIGMKAEIVIDPSLSNLLSDKMDNPLTYDEFVKSLTGVEANKQLDYFFCADKTINGLVCVSSWLADEGLVSNQTAKTLKKKRSFLQRIFKS